MRRVIVDDDTEDKMRSMHGLRDKRVETSRGREGGDTL